MLSICAVGDAVDSENENAVVESKASKEPIDFKEVKRIDHILASLQRKVLDPKNNQADFFVFKSVTANQWRICALDTKFSLGSNLYITSEIESVLWHHFCGFIWLI